MSLKARRFGGPSVLEALGKLMHSRDVSMEPDRDLNVDMESQ